jgi:hypothetical protein
MTPLQAASAHRNNEESQCKLKVRGLNAFSCGSFYFGWRWMKYKG